MFLVFPFSNILCGFFWKLYFYDLLPAVLLSSRMVYCTAHFPNIWKSFKGQVPRCLCRFKRNCFLLFSWMFTMDTWPLAIFKAIRIILLWILSTILHWDQDLYLSVTLCIMYFGFFGISSKADYMVFENSFPPQPQLQNISFVVWSS